MQHNFELVPPLPPLLFNVIVYIFGVQFAMNVLDVAPAELLGEYVPPDAYVYSSLFQLHVYPVFVIVGSVTVGACHVAVNVTVPPFVVVKFLNDVPVVALPLHALLPTFAVDVVRLLPVHPVNKDGSFLLIF